MYASPGNAGISRIAECFPVSPTDLDGQVELALREKPDLVLVAPDDPLAMGLVDRLQAVGIRAFGPTARAARIESNKAYSKELMADAGVPTASFRVFTDPGPARDYILDTDHRVVVKASGLAAGKGAIVTSSRDEALAAVEEIMVARAFGDAGDQVVIEGFTPWGACSAGGFGNTLQLADGTLVSCYSYHGDDDYPHIEVVRWRLP